jgi:iron complex transport system substrate-binding protein
MKKRTKTIALLEIAIVLCSVFLVAIPAIAAQEQNQEMQKVSASTITTASEDDFVLGVYGNANEDDTIDMRDLTYEKLIFFGKKPETELADAKYDGKINPLDFIQIKLIIVGKEKELTFEDSLGEAVTVRKPVERIVVEMSDSAEILRALNAKNKIVAVSEWFKDKDAMFLFPELSKLPSVGSWSEPDYEAILNLNPDVVIPFGRVLEYKEKLPGVTIVSLSPPGPYTFAENVRKLGYILDKEDESEEFIDWYEGPLNTIKSRTEGLSDDEKPKVFYWSWFEPGGGYKTISKTAWRHEMCEIAGGINVAADLKGGIMAAVDAEWVMEQNPDIIVALPNVRAVAYGYSIDDPSEMAAAREGILNRPELANINAVRNRKVYLMDLGVWWRPSGGGALIGTAYMAKWFHPELFEDLDPQAIHQEYIDRFCHIDFNVYEHGVFVYPPLEG